MLFGKQQKTTRSQDAGCSGTRDTLTISASGKEKLVKNTKGRTHNTNVDKSIDLKSYIASAQKTNQKIIDNPNLNLSKCLFINQPINVTKINVNSISTPAVFKLILAP